MHFTAKNYFEIQAKVSFLVLIQYFQTFQTIYDRNHYRNITQAQNQSLLKSFHDQRKDSQCKGFCMKVVGKKPIKRICNIMRYGRFKTITQHIWLANLFDFMNNQIQKLLVIELSLSMPTIRSSVLLLILLCLIHAKLLPHNSVAPSQHDQLVNVKALANISNLGADNWVLGSISIDQYYSRRFNTTKNYNTSLCPLEQPFVLAGSTACAQCPTTKPIFVLSNDTCVGCPPGESFDSATNQCQNINQPSTPPKQPSPNTAPPNASLADTSRFTNITNLDGNNWVLGSLTMDEYTQKRFLITKTQNTSLCPLATPYVLKGKTDCEQCPSSTPIFSLQNDTCISCAAGQYFDNQTNQCLNKNATKVSNTAPPPSQPSSVPLADTSSFVNITNLDANNWIMGNMTQDEYDAKRFAISSQHNITLCPLSAPYVLKDTTICQQCPAKTPIFVLANDTCIGCSTGEFFNNKTNQCENINATTPATTNTTSPSSNGGLVDAKQFTNVTNLDANNWIMGNMTQDEYDAKRFAISSQHNTSLCPLNKPFVLKGTTICQQCPPATPIFVLANDSCIGCSTSEFYNNKTNQCENINQTTPVKPAAQNGTNGELINATSFINITNLDAKNWILGNTTIEKYQVGRFDIVSKQNTTQCNIETPYVIQGHGGICEQCPEQKPLFVLANSTCIPCVNGTVWNITVKNCTEVSKTQANVTNTTIPNMNNATQPNVTNATTPNVTNATAPNVTNATQTNVTNTTNTTEQNVSQVKPNATQPNVTNTTTTNVTNTTSPNVTTPNVTTPNATSPNVTTPNVTTLNATTLNVTNTTTPNVTNTTTQNVTTPNVTNTTTPNVTTPNVTTPNVTNTTQPNITNQTNNTTPTKNDTKVSTPAPPPSNTTTPTSVPKNQSTTPQPSNNQTNASTPQPTPSKNTTTPTVPQPTSNQTTPNETKIGAAPPPTPNATEPLDIDTCSSFMVCPAGHFFNYATHNCEACEPGQYFEEDFQACLFCPDDSPLLNEFFKCVKCPAGKQIDRKSNKCL